MDVRRSLLVVLCALFLGACGPGDEEAVFVRIETWGRDVPLPSNLVLVGLEDRTLERATPLEPVKHALAGVYKARGVGEGYYAVASPDSGWQMLALGSGPPRLHANPSLPPNAVVLAQPHVLYFRPQQPNVWRLLPQAALLIRTQEEPDRYERVPAEVGVHEAGWHSIALPRVAPGVRARFQLHTLFEGNLLGKTQQLDLTGDVAVPHIRNVEPASVASLPLFVVGRERADAEPIELLAVPEGIPLDVSWPMTVQYGRASLPAYGGVGEALRIEWPALGSEGVWRFGEAAWREGGPIFLADLAAGPLEVADVAYAEGDGPDAVSVLDEATLRFAAVPYSVGEGRLRARVPAGSRTLLVKRGKSFAWLERTADAPATLGPFAAAARLVGRVPRTQPGFYVRIERRLDDERWTAGQGFERLLDAQTFDLLLPAGRYRASVVRTDRRTSKPHVLPFELEPGTLVPGLTLDVD